MNRGVARRPLFEDRGDQRFFLARLARQVRLGRVEVHSYCLMTTHFHMLVRSPVGQLSEAMRRVQNEHSRHFNRRRKRDGTLIRGRFYSKPVRSLAYRQTLVRYIDQNPVLAGVVRGSIDYPFGSARDYTRSTGPRWLTRHWVESEACLVAGTDRFTAAAYMRAFGSGLSAEANELVLARIESTAVDDHLDDLIGAAPERVRAWMQRKARLADGCRVGQPVCGRRSLKLALSKHLHVRGQWPVEDGALIRNGADLVHAGLLRDLCGLGWREVASTAGGSQQRARRRVAHHRRLVRTNADYAERAACVAKAAVDRCARRIAPGAA